MARFLSSRRTAVLISLVALWWAGARAAAPSSTAMASAAEAFLKGLGAEQRQQATFAFDSQERFRWHFIPSEMFPRNGLTLKAMTAAQRTLARKLIESGLSQRGYLTATSIMDLETVLDAIEAATRRENARGTNTPMVRDPEKYYFSVFGTPAPKGMWGWRVDGHHLSLNFTIVNGTVVASSPEFFGANPAEVREGPNKGQRILALQEDTARTLLTALNDSQRATAVIDAKAPNDIATTNTLDIKPLAPSGIMAAALTAAQRDLLIQVIDAYVGAMAGDIASERMEKLRRAGIDKIGFAWAGESERGKRHYYRVQGPTFLIEYDNTQNDANHIHSVWRDFEGDFGRDVLREHLKTAAH
jgi:hypothetical protein